MRESPDDRTEEENVVFEELRQIGIAHGGEHLQILFHVGLSLLEDASRLDDGVHRLGVRVG